MQYQADNTVRDIQIAYIGGGSRGWAWGFMADIATDAQLEGTVRLYDVDVEAAQRNKIIGDKISAHDNACSKWTYTVAQSLQEALCGADFVIISILPGTFKEMRSDVHAPEQYGIYQSVGDSIGLGGFMRAMRTIPMFVEIGQAIEQYAPKAWVINYTNPMSLCVRTLYAVFPNIKAFGCCHEVFGTQKLLCSMIEEKLGVKGVKRQDLKTTVTGINHFTWLSSASYRGMDLMPLYREFALTHFEEGYDEGQDANWMNSSFACAHRVKFDLFLKYGLIAAAGDRHLAEFVPAWYLKDPETVKTWKFGLTTVDWRVADLKKRLQRSDDLISGRETLTLAPSGEEGHLLIKALLGLDAMVSNVNIPNRGQIPNLPLGCVVETNALFVRDQIQPIIAGALPCSLLPIIARHVYNQENTLRAAMETDRDLAFTTFLADPQMTLPPREAKALFDQMLAAQRDYLPHAWFQ